MDGGKSAQKYTPPAPALGMKLRERKAENGGSGKSTPRAASPEKQKPQSVTKAEMNEETIAKQDVQTSETKKLPRVILKVGPPPNK